MNEGFDAALAKAGRLQDIFGRDNLFVELQDHGIPEQRRTNPQLLEIARRLQAPLLATNDSHYVHQHDAVAHDALLCVQTGSLMSDPDRFKFHGDHHYLKTADEMRAPVRRGALGLRQLAVDRGARARRDRVRQAAAPRLPAARGLRHRRRVPRAPDLRGRSTSAGATRSPTTVVERLAYELKVIGDMGFSSYFLIVWDLIRHAREHGHPGRSRPGIAAGCAVAYCLRITDLDPIRYDLLFERFLNPSRISMPDIDMDFDSRYRDEMIRYAAERYGRDHVAQIVTFSTIKARAAVRDAARVLGSPVRGRRPDRQGDAAAHHGSRHAAVRVPRGAPEVRGRLQDGRRAARDVRRRTPTPRKVIDVAKGLEGLRRQDGIHAAAVVITKEPLTEYLPDPAQARVRPRPIDDAPVVTQYEMGGVEELGPAQDGLPRPAQPRRHHRHPGADRRHPG